MRRFPLFCAPGAAGAARPLGASVHPWLLVACLTTTAGLARAESVSPPLGAAPLERGRGAWSRGEFDVAETLFKEALSQGGLAHPQVLEAYIYLGATRVILKKREPALIAFRMAALLDPRFKPPQEAGKKAAVLADLARKQDVRIGELVVLTETPKSIPIAQPFTIKVMLDAGHAAIMRRVKVRVSDGLGGKTYEHDEPSATEVTFTVPGNLAMADTTLVVKVLGLDGHDNELAGAEDHVKVQSAENKVVPMPVSLYSPSTGSSTKKEGGGGFWSTPWPYVIGGAALAAGGTAVYFGTRPGDQVSVSAVRVQAIR